MSSFRFKQFEVQQNQSALKVTTEACLFATLINVPTEAKNLLDVGTGTGVLALMLSQRYPQLQITGIDIHPGSISDAVHNVSRSPFSDQIKILLQDVLYYTPSTKFDVIVSNPPFFIDALHSPKDYKNKAKHVKRDFIYQFAAACATMIHSESLVFLWVPSVNEPIWIRHFENLGFTVTARLCIHKWESDPAFRTLIEFKKYRDTYTVPSLKKHIIYADKNTLSDSTKVLLKDFYLFL